MDAPKRRAMSMTIRLEYTGKFTTGYYNEMEGGYPVFIDDEPLSELVKDLLEEKGLDSNFCRPGIYWPFRKPDKVKKNPLVGRRVRLILEIEDNE